ncbi:MAG: 50S ribosomal protein L5 [Christensenellaceae bacterium]
MSRLKDKYIQEAAPALKAKFNYANVMQVPKLEKIVINMGVGDARENSRAIEVAANELSIIAGQKAAVTTAKKSIANFKVREGMKVGCKVTLRGERMYEYMDKLISIALPRVRDFRGISSKSFDGRGNYAMGVREQLIYPEINYSEVDKVRGMDIIFVTTAETDEEALELLKLLGMPFAQNS